MGNEQINGAILLGIRKKKLKTNAMNKIIIYIHTSIYNNVEIKRFN